MKKTVSFLLIVILVVLVGYILGKYWSYIFAKNIEGEVVKVERLMDPISIISRNAEPSSKLFSFAVAIKDKESGEIYTASTEDRQWAAVQGDGLCAQAKFLPYPPWMFDKAGTYYGARLLKLWNCADKKP
jgi:hypothetical protein